MLEELAILFRCPNCDILIAKAHKLRKPVKQNNKRPFIMFKLICSLHLSRFELNLNILKICFLISGGIQRLFPVKYLFGEANIA